MIVLDASAVVELLLRTHAGDAIVRRIDAEALAVPHLLEVEVAQVWQLRANLTAYDAVYVALAEALGAPLLTCDRHLARAPGLRAVVEHFA